MGVATKKGQVIGFDHDIVAEANLMGQLVFDLCHIKEMTPKVLAALKKLQALNHSLKFIPLEEKIERSREVTQYPRFQAADVIISAVDSPYARSYLEELAYRVSPTKPIILLEGGIGGTRGSGVVSIPYRTESYIEKFRAAETDSTNTQVIFHLLNLKQG